MATEYFTTKQAAAIIRQELKKAFPGIKFSVRTNFYSMGSHVSVSYADGPTVRAVEEITDQFYGRGFDGMTDSTTYHDSTFQGRTVHFQGSRPSVSRNLSDESMLETVKTMLAEQWNPNTGSAYGDKRGIVRFLAQGYRTV